MKPGPPLMERQPFAPVPASGSPVSGLLYYGDSQMSISGLLAGRRARVSWSSGWACVGDRRHGHGLSVRAAFISMDRNLMRIHPSIPLSSLALACLK